MRKNYLIGFLIFTFIFTNAHSFDFNTVYNIKTFSSAKLEINDTNLVDQRNAENLVENIQNLNDALVEKSK